MSSEADYVSEDLANELVSACRTTVGDRLRSVTYFDTVGEEQLYLRDDLEPGANIVGFADNERLGFRSKTIYDGSELGEYQFTIRVFEHGYLTRVIGDYHGTFVTTDRLPTDRFEDLASAVESVLEDHEST
ncbi:DUF7522 family protein [Halobacterium bonnevillei]|jgi:hypothetical protein|uniref:Uncharacterized protein n=1 Tax=Halobacterium bonnevillei TaxID=2692200 RepID=A0A6B0SK41_9EURY|nr:hypothetical protein [Halobacterium bonnevillei]MXR22035.1 hypothetical protein [Halobacterium bonnevillei]